MIYFFSPYALDGDFGKAYNMYMHLLPTEGDWACFTDLDTMFLNPAIGHQLQNYINHYPSTGLFTCYTNRVGNEEQCYRNVISAETNLLEHRKIALQLKDNNDLQVRELTTIISGHMMMVKKETWRKVGMFPEGGGILGIDNKFSKRILNNGFKILLMQGVYLLHFYRLDTGIHSKTHLKL